MMNLDRMVARLAILCVLVYLLLRVHWHEERLQVLEDHVLATTAAPNTTPHAVEGACSSKLPDPPDATPVEDAADAREDAADATEDAADATEDAADATEDAPSAAVVLDSVILDAAEDAGAPAALDPPPRPSTPAAVPPLSGFQRTLRRRSAAASE